MSIQTAIENAQQKVANAYTAVNNKGGTLPATQDLSNLPTAINTISTAGTVETLNVTPTTSAQQFIPSGGVDGYNPVNVSAVTSNIDANITAGNIKSGVSILGVNGSVVELNGETRNVSLTNANGQTFTPSSNKNAITSITITPNNQNRTVTPTTNQQTLTVNSGYSGNGTVTVDAVTSAIDSSIQPENIKKDVVILGTTGSYEGAGANIDSLNVTPTTSAQTITASGGVDGYSPVNVSAVTSSIDPNIVPNKIRNGCVILGVTGTYGEPLPRGIILTSGISGYLVDGDFYLCGRNNYGQQGTGDTTNVTTFRKVAENVAQIVLTQYSSGYLTTTGDFYLCGWNNAGQQGTGDTTNVTTFRKVAENVAQVFLSNFTSGYITTTGDFYLCGANDAGQQGNGTSGSATNVTTFTKRGENVAQIFLSKDTSGYLTTTGDFYLCGNNYTGQQGNGSTSNVTTFTKRGENVAQIFLTSGTISGYTYIGFTSAYLTTTGDFYLCGGNYSGQQGNGTTSNVTTFRKVAENVAQIVLTQYSSGYLTTTGDFYLCGNNYTGQQGNGTSGSASNVTTFTKRGENVAQIFLSDNTSGYITTSGDFYLCGSGSNGQQGNGSTSNVTTFTKQGENVAQIVLSGNTSGYISTTGDFYLCGNNQYGQQGSGNTTNVTTFTKRN